MAALEAQATQTSTRPPLDVAEPAPAYRRHGPGRPRIPQRTPPGPTQPMRLPLADRVPRTPRTAHADSPLDTSEAPQAHQRLAATPALAIGPARAGRHPAIARPIYDHPR